MNIVIHTEFICIFVSEDRLKVKDMEQDKSSDIEQQPHFGDCK